jgi:hypothetical protein
MAPRKPAAKKPAAAKMASLIDFMATMAAAPSASAFAHKVLDKSPAHDVAPDSYIGMLNDTSVDNDSPPLADYDDYNDDMEEGLEGDEFGEDEVADGDEEGELQEIEEGAFEGILAKAKGRVIRTGNYTEFEDVCQHPDF